MIGHEIKKSHLGQHHHLRHWHHVYRHRRAKVKIRGRDVFLGQILSLGGALLAGILIELNKFDLAAVAGAFVVLPGIFDLTASLAASLSAKINHQLGDTNHSQARVYVVNTFFSIILSICSGAIVGLAGGALAVLFFNASFWHIFRLTEMAIVISATIGFPISGLLSIYFRNRRINPDDTVEPIETSLFEIITAAALILSLRLLA